jgi:signal transduction histidine kinase
MSLCLLIAVTIFFMAVVTPSFNGSLAHFETELARTFAAAAPDLAAARAFRQNTGVDVAYRGPLGEWSTTRRPIDFSEKPREYFVALRNVTVVPAPGGGEYAFVWRVSGDLYHAHTLLFSTLLGIMTFVVLAAYVTLRRLLRPVRDLGEGVARLSAGRFEPIVVPPRRDEFGALTTAFNQMVERLGQMVTARDQLLTDVSHELRSPLTRMKVALEMVAEGDARTRMSADVAEMEAMVAELLEIERLRDGRGLDRVETPVGPLIEDVVRAFDGVAPGVIVSPHGDATMLVDSGRMRIVLRNLIENALKYSLNDSAPVRVELHVAESLVIRVLDDGRGIPAEDVGQVFVPFFRVDRSRSKKTGGYGLGLSICQRIVEAHGGTIEAQPNPPRGTIFTLKLPNQ